MSWSGASVSPCKACENRYLGCHDKCDAYKSWKCKTKVESKTRRDFIDGVYKDNETKLTLDKNRLLHTSYVLSTSPKAISPMNMRTKINILGIQMTNYGTANKPLFSKRDVAGMLGVERLMIGYKPSMLVKKKICSGFSEDILLNMEGVIHTILNISTKKGEELKERLISEVFVLSR